jgi:anti-sigma regulatory factor (Ser/Thr protein kinase)/ActR/RegA family two-component response regulator
MICTGRSKELPNRKTVLVVESDKSTLRLLKATLKAPQWRLLGVADVRKAESVLRRNSVDVVLIGLELPPSDSIECVSLIHSMQPASRIILATKKGPSDRVIQLIGEHVFSYFSRPLQVEPLSEMLARAAAAKDWQDGIEILSAHPQWISLRLRCRKITADRVIQFFREIRMDLPEPDREPIGMAFREMLLNAIEHGGHFDPSKTVTVSRFHAKKAIIYHIQDPGQGFAFDDLRHAAVTNPPESPVRHMIYRSRQGLRPGGFGILLTRRLVDEVVYNEKGNEVLLIKYSK